MNEAGICECCGGTGRARPITIADLRAWCRENGHVVLAGDFVRTETAAALTGREPQSLRVDRMRDEPRVPYTRRGRRCLYWLGDLLDVD